MDKKYVLAKDLPFAEKGTEVFIQKIETKRFYGICVKNNDEIFCLTTAYKNPEEELQKLLAEGWIKEVKPMELREFWLNIYINKNISAFPTSTEAHMAARDESGNRIPHIEIIHVREVLPGEEIKLGRMICEFGDDSVPAAAAYLNSHPTVQKSKEVFVRFTKKSMDDLIYPANQKKQDFLYSWIHHLYKTLD